MVEGGPAIVLGVVSKFGTEVTRVKALETLVSVDVTEGDHESLHSIIVLVDNAASKDHTVRAEAAQITWPVLRARDSRAVNDKFVGRLVKSRCSLERSHIGTMTELCLGIAAHNLVVLDQREPVLALFIIAERFHGSLEHRVVQAEARQESLQVVHPEEVRVVVDLTFREHIRQSLVDVFNALPELSLLLMGCHFVEGCGLMQCRVLLQ